MQNPGCKASLRLPYDAHEPILSLQRPCGIKLTDFFVPAVLKVVSLVLHAICHAMMDSNYLETNPECATKFLGGLVLMQVAKVSIKQRFENCDRFAASDGVFQA